MPECQIKIMHLVFSLGTGGLENGVVNLCNHLSRSRFQPSICVLQQGGELESRVDAERVELFEVKRLRNNDPTVPFRLAWQLRLRQIDILHTHSWGTLLEGFAAAKLARTPSIIHGEHGILEMRRRNIFLQRKLWSRTQQVTAVAASLADSMANTIEFPRNKILVVPNGVDTNHFISRPETRADARRQFGLPLEGLIVGMVARMVPVKNHHGLIEAISILLKEGKSITLAFAGGGQLRGELQRFAADLGIAGKVHFLGDIGNVNQFLNALDIFVLNSHVEGMSNTVLEAMSCGLPVIATSVGANSSLIRDGETGFLVPADNVDALSNAISRMVASQSLRLRMGVQARTQVEANFGIAGMVAEYSRLYRNLNEKHLSAASNTRGRARSKALRIFGTGSPNSKKGK